MKADFLEILAQMKSGKMFVGRHLVGSAFFLDEEEYARQGEMFADAVRQLTISLGEPIQPNPHFPGLDVEKGSFWQKDKKFFYALLTFEDNTRIRDFYLGVARRGEVVIRDR